MTVYRYQHDFEVGILVKSPCKDCELKKELPRCMENCKLIDRVQALLAKTRSCTCN